jgi:hypothetical protein
MVMLVLLVILDDEEFETTALYPSSSQVGPRTQMGLNPTISHITFACT